MRAVCWSGQPGVLAMRELGEVTLAPGDVLVRPTHVLVTEAPAPRVLGAWGVGVVERVGTGAAMSQGTRVAVAQVHACGVCERCRGGLAQHCLRRAEVSRDVDGLWADGCVVSASALHAVPPALSSEAACCANPFALVLHAARHVAIATKPFVTILGDGVPALLAASWLTRLNASVRLLSDSDATLALADRMGIRHRAARETGHRADQDVVLDATFGAWTHELPPRLLRPRGQWILLSGEPLHPPPGVGTPHELRAAIARLELSVQGVTQPPPALLREALDALATSGVDTSPLTSPSLGFWDLEGVRHAWHSRPALGVLLRA